MDAGPEDESRGSSGSGGLTTILAIVVGIGVLAGGWWLSREQQLTIIVVSLDTTRPDHLSAYGYDRETTPTLARLAREGTRFTSARSTTSWTLPSHMSLFTGLPPDLHNVTIDFQTLDLGRPTMGEIFSDAGFRTTGVYSAPYVHDRFGFARGMDLYESATRNPMVYDLPPERMSDPQLMSQLELNSHREVTSRRLRDRATHVLTKRRAYPKTFLFLHFFDPHYDYLPPAAQRAAFTDPRYRGPVDGLEVLGRPESIHPGMAPADRAQLMGLYDAEIRFVDDSLADVVAAVEESGRLGSTIVVVTGDHGEEFFEDGRIGHRMTLREEVLRVPLIVWGPGLVPEGRVVEDDVALYDVLPTLMDYAGLEPDDRIYGRSLRPLIEGGSLPPRPTTAALTFLHRDGPEYYTRHDACVYDGMKYVRRLRVPWSPEDPTRIDNVPDLASAEIEVYDLEADPGERENLISKRGQDPRVEGIIRTFEAEQARQESALRTFRPEGSPTDGHVPQDFDDVLRQMKMMGYLEDIGAASPPQAGPPGQDG